MAPYRIGDLSSNRPRCSPPRKGHRAGPPRHRRLRRRTPSRPRTSGRTRPSPSRTPECRPSPLRARARPAARRASAQPRERTRQDPGAPNGRRGPVVSPPYGASARSGGPDTPVAPDERVRATPPAHVPRPLYGCTAPVKAAFRSPQQPAGRPGPDVTRRDHHSHVHRTRRRPTDVRSLRLRGRYARDGTQSPGPRPRS